MPNNAPQPDQTLPTLAQIYEKTYCDELAKQTPDIKARILAAKDANNDDRLVNEWVAMVASKAEVTYEILTTKEPVPNKKEVQVKSDSETAPIK
jgi:hypothetical protein